jgi:carbamoyltransferase
MNIIGVSGLYHDSAVALVTPEFFKANAEERFTRIKHDNSLPVNALKWAGEECGNEVDYIVFYERPLLKFDRIQTLRSGHIKNWGVYHKTLKEWASYKIWVRPKIKTLCEDLGIKLKNEILFTDHHQAHAASAYYPSSFEKAGVLCLDGVGEWCTGSISLGEGNNLINLKQQLFPHSIGLFYATITSLAGFKVNSGEYKLMGLAPYGNPVYTKKLLENVIHVNENGGVELNLKYFGFLEGNKMYSSKLCQLLHGSKAPIKVSENGIPTQEACDLAASAQEICNTVMARASRYTTEVANTRNLAIAGGVALNAVSVGHILEQGIVDEIFVQPASSDAGGALGAALMVAASKNILNRNHVKEGKDGMRDGFLGYRITNSEVVETLEKYSIKSERQTRQYINKYIAEKLSEGAIVAVARDSMEYGARALGNRSILADPRGSETQKRLNLAVKKRESFRPFAPVILASEVKNWCEYPYGSKYMTLTSKIKKEKQYKVELGNSDLKTKLETLKSEIPAVTHVDYSARTQIVENGHPLHAILTEFFKKTETPVLVNTSFNLRGEPIVMTAEDGLKCFASSDIDYLVLQDYIIGKKDIVGKKIPAPVTKED